MLVETVQSIDKQTPTIGPQRKMLEKLRDRCKSLNEVLIKMGTTEKQYLWNYPKGSEEIQSQLRDYTNDLYWVSVHALHDIKGKKSPRTIDAPVWNLINKLAEIWTEGTSTEPQIIHVQKRDSYKDESYKGDFFYFLILCFNMGGVRFTSKPALAKTALKVLKSRENKPTKN